MKKSKLIFVVSVLGILLTACDPEIEYVNSETISVSTIVDFENIKLNADSIWNGSDGSGFFTTKVASFQNSYNSTWFSWSGFACSAKTDIKTASFSNQYSVSAGIGANGSKQFAIAYNTATLICDSNVYGNFNIRSIGLTNTTYAYLDMKNGSDYSKKFVAGDWYKVIITGYLNDVKTKEIAYYLADFRENKTFISSSWNKVDLSEIGKIDKLTFTFDSSDKGQWGINTPAYVCIDNIEFSQTFKTK